MSRPKPKTQASLNHTLAGAALSPPGTLQEEEDRAVALLDLAIALIDSALDILTSHIRSDAQLKHPSKLLPGGTVGKHFRHLHSLKAVIETYRAFLLPLLPSSPSSSTAGPLEINYDAILPATRHPIARNLGVCRREMRKIKDDLEEFKERYRLPYDPAPGGGVAGETDNGLTKVLAREARLVAITPSRQDLRTSVGRELWFCSLHAIHHFSMLRAIAVHELGLNLPTEFGTAPSTLLYREQKPVESDFKQIKAKL